MPRYGRKRRSKRRINKISLARMLGNPSRKYETHSRGLKLTSIADRIVWCCTEGYGSIPEHKTIIESASAVSAFDADLLTYDYLVSKEFGALHIRNLSNHEAFMTVYVLGNKIELLQNTTNGKTDSRLDVMYHLFDGWDQNLSAALATDTGTGTEVVYTEDQPLISTYNSGLNLYNSKDFLKKFFIVKKATVKMNPGDDVWVPVSVPSQMYSHKKIALSGSGGTDGQAIDTFVKPYKGRWILLRYHGALGMGDVANEAVSGYMHIDMCYEELHSAKVLQIQAQGDYGVHLTTTRDTITDGSTNLQGPSDHTMTTHDHTNG